MIITLERRGFISRVPGQARTIKVLYPNVGLPGFEAPTEPQRKKIKPDDTLPLTLSERERHLLCDPYLGLSTSLEDRIRLAIVDKKTMSVRLTLDDFDELAGCVATAANHTESAKKQKELKRVFSRIQSLLETYTDE